MSEPLCSIRAECPSPVFKWTLAMFYHPGIIRRVFYSCTLYNVICFCLCFVENLPFHVHTLYIQHDMCGPSCTYTNLRLLSSFQSRRWEKLIMKGFHCFLMHFNQNYEILIHWIDKLNQIKKSNILNISNGINNC